MYLVSTNPEHLKLPVKIYLDGVEQLCCFEVDDKEGYVVRAVLDVEGRYQLDPNDPTELWREKVYGKVEIKVM